MYEDEDIDEDDANELAELRIFHSSEISSFLEREERKDENTQNVINIQQRAKQVDRENGNIDMDLDDNNQQTKLEKEVGREIMRRIMEVK